MKGKPDNFEELGYKRRIESHYIRSNNTTVIREYIYDPDEEDEKDREIEDWVIDIYDGKPDPAVTRQKIRFIKEDLWGESIDGIEIIDWESPLERLSKIEIDDGLSDEDLVFYEPSHEYKHNKEPLYVGISKHIPDASKDDLDDEYSMELLNLLKQTSPELFEDE